jgi:hypothetical protein
MDIGSISVPPVSAVLGAAAGWTARARGHGLPLTFARSVRRLPEWQVDHRGAGEPCHIRPLEWS